MRLMVQLSVIAVACLALMLLGYYLAREAGAAVGAIVATGIVQLRLHWNP